MTNWNKTYLFLSIVIILRILGFPRRLWTCGLPKTIKSRRYYVSNFFLEGNYANKIPLAVVEKLFLVRHH